MLCSILIIALPGFAETDWENFSIRVSIAAPADAVSSLKSELMSLQYDAARSVADFLSRDFSRQNRLEELLRENMTVSQQYLTDGSVEFIAQIPLANRIIGLLMPETRSPRLVVPMVCPCCGQDWPPGKPVPAGVELVPKELESVEYTGIIIDCRGLQFIPALFPRIVNEVGEEVFSVDFADAHAVVDNGLIYFTTKDIFNLGRIGYNPLRIRAMAATGEKSTDIRISSFDARRIHGSKKNLSLLKECRVAVIFGQ
jgi:hypothetical protein